MSGSLQEKRGWDRTSCDNPSYGSETHGEQGREDPDEDTGNPSRGFVAFPRILILPAQACNNGVANTLQSLSVEIGEAFHLISHHSQRAEDEYGFSPDA